MLLASCTNPSLCLESVLGRVHAPTEPLQYYSQHRCNAAQPHKVPKRRSVGPFAHLEKVIRTERFEAMRLDYVQAVIGDNMDARYYCMSPVFCPGDLLPEELKQTCHTAFISAQGLPLSSQAKAYALSRFADAYPRLSRPVERPRETCDRYWFQDGDQ
jgi:hypothetical protein